MYKCQRKIHIQKKEYCPGTEIFQYTYAGKYNLTWTSSTSTSTSEFSASRQPIWGSSSKTISPTESTAGHLLSSPERDAKVSQTPAISNNKVETGVLKIKEKGDKDKEIQLFSTSPKWISK